MRRNSLCHDKKLTTPGSSSWMLSTIARSTLILQVECAKNLGIGVSTPASWEPQFRDNDGDIPVIGSDNYASEEAKEIARLKRELRNAEIFRRVPLWIQIFSESNLFIP